MSGLLVNLHRHAQVFPGLALVTALGHGRDLEFALQDLFRAAVKEMTTAYLPALIVLSYNEVTRDTRIESAAMVCDPN